MAEAARKAKEEKKFKFSGRNFSVGFSEEKKGREEKQAIKAEQCMRKGRC